MSIGFGFGVGRTRGVGLPASVVVDAPPPPVGFALNGSANPVVRAMLTRVRAGSGRGRIVFKGDSTTVGQGAGSGPLALASARSRRPPAVLASELSASGVQALDNGFYGTAGCYDAGVMPDVYDDRLSREAPPWTVAGGNDTFRGFAGAGFMSDTAGVLGYTLAAVDTFEIVFYNSNHYAIELTIDGGPPASVTLAAFTGGPAATIDGNAILFEPGQGCSRIVVKAATIGTHRLGLATRAGTYPGLGALRSITGHAAGVAAIDILCHAACGAQSAEQARARPDLWGNNDALAFDSPDLTIVNLALNDGAHGVAPEVYAANLQAIVDRARVSGDVLLVAPHPAAPSFAPLAVQAGLRDAAAAVAARNHVAFMSLFDHFGSAFDSALAARMTDGIVHGDADFYASVGKTYARCLAAMVA